MTACAEIQHIEIALHNALRRLVQLAELHDLAPAHLRITMYAKRLQTLLLNKTRLDNTLSYSGRRFARLFVAQLAEIYTRQRNLHINAVHQRPGNLTFITINFRLLAAAALDRIAEKAAGTRVLSSA